MTKTIADGIPGPLFTFFPVFTSSSGPFGDSQSVTFLGKSEKKVPRVAESDGDGSPGTDPGYHTNTGRLCE